MSKEGSVAPKERVNITYKPATGNAKEEVELPLKLLMLGDYTQRPDPRPLEDRKPISVDKDNFQKVMGEQKLGLSFNVKDRLTEGEDSEITVNLKFRRLSDMEPEAIANQVPSSRSSSICAPRSPPSRARSATRRRSATRSNRFSVTQPSATGS
jgi:type VI secretion system protein ImpB